MEHLGSPNAANLRIVNFDDLDSRGDAFPLSLHASCRIWITTTHPIDSAWMPSPLFRQIGLKPPLTQKHLTAPIAKAHLWKLRMCGLTVAHPSSLKITVENGKNSINANVVQPGGPGAAIDPQPT